MSEDKKIREIVRNKYAGIALQNGANCCEPEGASCCGPTADYSMFNDDYSSLSGYVADADLHLGCGLPTEYAGINAGDRVLDLGSGAGNDVFVARSLTGENGHVIGVDMTQEMIDLANRNKEKLGYANVEFRSGEIENLPVEYNDIDVVISNCVLNLVPNKPVAFAEIFRVLKPGAHFCISDVVYRGEMSDGLRRSAEMYAGCVSGALREADYLLEIEKSGFKNIEVKGKKQIAIPAEVLQKYSESDDVAKIADKEFGIFSITVVAVKP